eukprot:CAMPEP_0171611020 /NCGR_PEP_ID=MMETSP0990-20121206/10383_1 /TAXON_ID=483369 /ORGANISM="non described non described, Strain CCMP2098" /LENGTH=138 /DNA_ID=CAMNT_0012174515 /DNA_START=15 /DNA_END=431 /DNA_ORIENTATION=+
MAFRLTRTIRFAVTKSTTGLVGLPVDIHGRVNLIAMQHKILESVKVLPEEIGYRKAVEANANYRLQMATEITDELLLEKEIGHGAQLEEMILEAEDELELIQIFLDEKPWLETPDTEWQADVDEDIARDIKREDAANM